MSLIMMVQILNLCICDLYLNNGVQCQQNTIENRIFIDCSSAMGKTYHLAFLSDVCIILFCLLGEKTTASY